MQGKILIVDAIATNRIVLKVKLVTAFYDVIQAATLNEAVVLAQSQKPDLIISALSLPDGTLSDLCEALGATPAATQIPVLAVSCNAASDDRMAALGAGAYDVLRRPVDATLLLGRVRSLIRAHNATADWQMRDDTSRALGLAEQAAEFDGQGACTLVSAQKGALQCYAMQLRQTLHIGISLAGPTELMVPGRDQSEQDVFVLIMSATPEEAHGVLRMIAALKANASTRHAGILVLQTEPDSALGANALDLGADDLMTDGFEAAELALRVKALIQRKRMAEQLRATVRTGLQAAVFDPLTGLYNRRYAMPHLERVAEHAGSSGNPFAVMAADLDHFKLVNDRYGHASGDAVLIDVANRLRRALRGSDMVARVGGEEFLIVMPGTTLAEAQQAALRICQGISAEPFTIPGSAAPIEVTISIGMILAGTEGRNGARFCSDSLLERADKALYAAKGRGRNQVTLGRPAA